MTTSLTTDRQAEIVKEISELHSTFTAAVHTSVSVAIEIGRRLVEVKAGLKHGQFLPWIEQHCSFGEETARTYVKAFKNQVTGDLTDKTTISKLAGTEKKKPKVAEQPKQLPLKEIEVVKHDQIHPYHFSNPAYELGLLNNAGGGQKLVDLKTELEKIDPVLLKSKVEDKDRLWSILLDIQARDRPDLVGKKIEQLQSEVDLLADEITDKQKFDRAVKKQVELIEAKYREQFQTQLKAEKDKLATERAEAWELKKKAKQEYDAAAQYRSSVDSHMTLDEFRLVLNCLHPDRAPADKRDRYEKAFHIFNRLEKTINPNIPISVKRDRGWAEPKASQTVN